MISYDFSDEVQFDDTNYPSIDGDSGNNYQNISLNNWNESIYYIHNNIITENEIKNYTPAQIKQIFYNGTLPR